MVRMGLYGREGSSLWVTTATEALYTWEWSAACDEISEGVSCMPAVPFPLGSQHRTASVTTHHGRLNVNPYG